MKQFINQIDMGHQHAPATVARAAKFVHSDAIADVFLQKCDVAFVEIGHDLRAELVGRLENVSRGAHLAAGEAANRNDHDGDGDVL